MSKSSQSAFSVTRLYDVPSRALPVESRDTCHIRHDGLVLAPGLDEAALGSRLSVTLVTRPNRQNSSLWLTIFEFVVEGFAMYAASYHVAPLEIAASLVEPSSRDARAQEPEEISWRTRRKAMAIVSAPTRKAAMDVEENAARAEARPETASKGALLKTDRTKPRKLLAKIWFIVAGRWAWRGRACEIKDTVAAVTELGSAASQAADMPSRHGIERVARRRRDS